MSALDCTLIAKFHYTGPTGHDQTKSADFVGDHGLRTGSREKVRAGPVGSGRTGVVEFSLKVASRVVSYRIAAGRSGGGEVDGGKRRGVRRGAERHDARGTRPPGAERAGRGQAATEPRRLVGGGGRRRDDRDDRRRGDGADPGGPDRRSAGARHRGTCYN